MATEKQIEANRRNSALSTGPKTEAGKAKSRANAISHGLASEHPGIEAARSAAFVERRAKWGAEVRPAGEAAGWALDCAVASSLRIDSCGRAMDDLVARTRQRARLAWDEDRAVEAAEAFSRLGRNPILAARQLRTIPAGALLLIDAWVALGQALRSRDWTEAEAGRALDLLGVDRDLREGLTAIDPREGDPVDFRRDLVAEEVEGLEELLETALIPLEEGECLRAIAGDLALISKPGRLLARYERDAWRRYRESMAEVGTPTLTTTMAAVAPAAPAPAAPRRVEVPDAEADREFEEERRALRAELAPFLEEAARAGFLPTEGGDVSDWVDAMERQLDEEDRLEGSRVGTNPISRAEPVPA